MTEFKEWTYEQVKKKAQHFKALGQKEIYLSLEPYPWSLVTDLKEGGTHRMDINTSIWFYATDPDNGLKLIWSFDIENRNANGKGYYEINQSECCRIMKLLPEKVKTKFKQYLMDCVKVIEKNAQEYLTIANKEFETAKVLKGIK
jgi:hypothetical protein